MTNITFMYPGKILYYFSVDISKKDLTEAGCSSAEMSTTNNIVEDNKSETNSSK